MVTSRLATLPTKSLASPLRPWVPMTRRSALRAARAIISWGTPSSRSGVARTPALRALATTASSRLRA